jgi:hypothetical protein
MRWRATSRFSATRDLIGEEPRSASRAEFARGASADEDTGRDRAPKLCVTKAPRSSSDERHRPAPDRRSGRGLYTSSPWLPISSSGSNARVRSGTPLFSHLSLLGVQSLIVWRAFGCAASVVDGHLNGFHVSIVEQCTFDRAELTHKVNLFDLHHKYADVMHLDEVVAHLDTMRMDRAAE